MFILFKKEIEKLKTDNKTLRNFGILFFFVFCLLSFYVYRKNSTDATWFFLIIGILFLASGLTKPGLLRGFYKLWMLFAFISGWVMTRVILSITFFVIITPMAIILKILGKDLLNEKIEKDAATYWIIHEAIKDKERYKKQF